MKLSVREMIRSDIEPVVDYFINSSTEYLESMGADKNKLPERAGWIGKLYSEYSKSYEEKEYYYIIWLADDKPVGHSNINKIEYSISATMHLHIWHPDIRKNGLGCEFIKQTLPFYFNNFKLENLICEPYSKNIPPNKVLKKMGFEFKRAYETIPGWINFHQIVNRYEMTRERFEKIIAGYL